MENCSAGLVPIQNGDKFSQMQCPKNDLERKEMESFPYASLVGSLMYTSTCTRPNISFVVGSLVVIKIILERRLFGIYKEPRIICSRIKSQSI